MKQKYFLVVISILTLLVFPFISSAERSIDLKDYQLEYTYSTINPGQEFNLNFRLINKEESKNEKIVLEVENNFPFKVLGERKIEIGSMNNRESITGKFKINTDKDAKFGLNKLSFKIKDIHEDYSGILELRINQNNPDIVIKEISSEPKIIVPEQNSIMIKVLIENKGKNKAENIFAKLNLPEGFSKKDSYSDTFSLSQLNSGDSKELIFFVSTKEDLMPRIYNADLLLEYLSGKNKETTYLDVTLPVLESPRFEIISSIPSKFFINYETPFKILIQNTGNQKAEKTSVSIIKKSSQPFEIENDNLELGTIAPFETGTATFSIKTKENAKRGQYILDVQIKTYINNQTIIYNKYLPVAIVENEKFLPYISTFLIISILFLIYFIVQRKFLYQK